MFIQVNTDHSIQSHEDVTRFVEEVVNSKLRALSGRITRVEVHLGDENAQKGGADDKRCMVEARIEGRPPTAVTHHDETLKKAGPSKILVITSNCSISNCDNWRAHT